MGEALTTMSEIGIGGFGALAVMVAFMFFIFWVASQGDSETVEMQTVEVRATVPTRDR